MLLNTHVRSNLRNKARTCVGGWMILRERYTKICTSYLLLLLNIMLCTFYHHNFQYILEKILVSLL